MRLLIGPIVFALGLGATAAAAQDLTMDPGEKVYTTQKCGVCHSIAGKGNKKGPLENIGTKLPADEIRAWITDAKTMTAKTKAARKPEMKSYALPKDDLDALVTYLAAMKKKT